MWNDRFFNQPSTITHQKSKPQDIQTMKYKGRFGGYGGYYVPEVLIPVLEELEEAFDRFHDDPAFVAELAELSTHYAGRPTPLYHARRFSDYVGFKGYLKREDLLHGGAHKVN